MSNKRIHQRKDGNYYFKLHGKTYVRAKRKDAEKYYAELVSNEKRRKLIEDYGKADVRTLMVEWLEIQRGLGKATTFDRKEQIVNNQIIPYIDEEQVIGLTSSIIQKWLNTLSDFGYSKSTMKKSKEYLQAALRFHKVLKKFEDNPFEDVKIPSTDDSKEIVYYTEKELKKIYAAARKKHTVGGKKENVYRLGDAVIVLGQTGMRSGEFLALTWDDVSLKNETITINHTRQRVKNRNKKTPTDPNYVDVTNPPKTKSSIRTIPMSTECKKALTRLERLNRGFKYVASTENGTPVSIRNFSRMFRDILYAAGMDKAVDEKGRTVNKIYGPHSMRHSFATNLINKKDANIAVVSALLGHADVSITINKYVHTKDEDKKQTIKLLD